MMALTASTMASASLTVEQFEFVAGCLLGLFLLLAVHLAVPTSRFEYDKAIQQQPSRSESKSITHHHQKQQQQVQPHPPAAHRPDHSIGSIGHDDPTSNTAAVKESSGTIITTMTTTMTATIPQEDEEEEAVFSGDGGDPSLLVATPPLPPAIVRRSWDEAEEQEKRDAKEEVEDDVDIDMAEGRDGSDADDTDGSIEVQPHEKRSVLALISEGVVDRVQSSNQRRALFLLDARGVPYEKVDGMDPAQREVRDGLFELAGFGAGKAVCYPQFFFVGEHGTISYVGDFERLLSLNDASDIPKEILDDHPDLETWERVFVNLVEPAVIASP